jgi:oxygen-dependent protoporphyrinogen oxidase
VQPEVAVIGAGISGLAAALELARAGGTTVTLYEGADRLGGKIRTEHQDGFLLDCGPDAFLNRAPHVRELCESLGLGDELVPVAAKARNIHLWHEERAVALPPGLVLGIPTGIGPLMRTPVLSFAGKLRAGLDLLIPRGGDEDETVGDFVRRRLGAEVLERILDPLLAGIHAGDPDRLAIRSAYPDIARMETNHRSLILALRSRVKQAPPRDPATPPAPVFLSLQRGLGSMVEAIAAELAERGVTVRTGEAIRAVEPLGAGGATVVHADGSRAAFLGVLVAAPARPAAGLFAESLPELAAACGRVVAASTAVIFTAWDRASIPGELGGTGLLVPRGSGRAAFAHSWSSEKFPGRAPSGAVLLRAFVGGRRDVARLAQSDAELVDAVLQDLRVTIGVTGAPRWTRLVRWTEATPQYEQGHAAVVRTIDAVTERHRGLELAGASWRGVGIPDCVRGARAAVERLRAQLGAAG